jgi:hypothetical protein
VARSCRHSIPSRRVAVAPPSGGQPGILALEWLEARLAMAAPTVLSPTVTGITPYQATLGGTVSSDGGNPLSFRGIVYSLTSVNPNPIRGGTGVAEFDVPGTPTTGTFTATVSPLTPNSTYSFRAFATNVDGTSYSPVTTIDASTFTTLPPNLAFPKDSFTPDPNDPNKLLNTILYFGPTKNDTNPRHQPIPTKSFTFTNNANFPVFPILVNTNATKDDLDPSQALYDPIDPIHNEYRGYLGYRNASGSFAGLLPGMAITVDIPLVFWDGGRIFISYDSTYMDMINNAPQVGQRLSIPNPFQYYGKNSDGSPTLNITLPAAGVTGAPPATSGVVMWYRQGLDLKDPKQPIGPSNDAPAQLLEFTIRDPVLSKINPNIDKLKPNFGETHALINYDVSYVDNMALPVAMAALDVPVPVSNPPLPKQTPYPGPRLPYGWVGSSQTVDQFQKTAAEFLSVGPSNGLGSYFGLSGTNQAPNYNGWTQYNFTVSNNISPAFGKRPLIKLPSGQDALADTPLGDVSSNYDVLANAYMLTSGGTDAKKVLGAGSAFSNGTKSLFIVANTPALRNILRTQLQQGMVVELPDGGPNAPVVPAGTVIERIGPADNPGFRFSDYTPPGGGATRVLEIGLSNVIPASGKASYSYTLTRPVTDYLSNALVNLWYTWANHYVTHLPAGAQSQSNLAGRAVPDAAKPAAFNNVIRLDAANTHLVPGMVVTGAGISTNPVDGATSIVAIDADHRTIHLSQGVTVGAQGLYSFALPTLSQLGGFNDPIVKLLTPFTPVPTPSVPDVNQFARNAFQLLSFMGQVPSDAKNKSPRSVQIVHNVIGGNVTKPTNLDGLHKIEVAYRTMVKSLLRSVNDFTTQLDQTLWYPDPSKPVAGTGQSFNIYNLDPFVWFVHQRLGLSGYGFSLDDDTADIGVDYATKLGISIGGLNGLPNQVEWTETAPFGPVSGTATVRTLGPDTIPYPYEIAGLPTNVWYSVKAFDPMNALPGAQVLGTGVSPGTFVNGPGLDAQTKFSFSLANGKNLPPLTSPIGSSTLYTLYLGGTPNPVAFDVPAGQTRTAVSPFTNSAPVRIPPGSTLKITTDVGSLTSYTQQIQQFMRVAGQTPPELFTLVRGTLDAGRVTIADGRLLGNGTVTGSLDVMGPLAGSTYVNSIGETITVNGTAGGYVQPGGTGGAPGVLTIGSAAAPRDIRMYGGTLIVTVKGGKTPGTDYGQLAGHGDVSLGNSTLDLKLNGYTLKPDESLVVVTTTGRVTGTFAQGTSMTVDGVTYRITYNANSVVVTRATTLRGTVFQDFDANGMVDAADPVLANRSVFLDTNGNGAPDVGEPSTRTNALGQYAFENLVAGAYRVRTVLPAGGAATRVQDVTLAAGDQVTGRDLGIRENMARVFLPVAPSLYSTPQTLATLNGALVDNLYLALLGRPADAAGRAGFVSRLNAGASVSEIAEGFVTSREYRTRLVAQYYTSFLGRTGAAAELQGWVDVLARGGSMADVIAGILASPEFRSGGHATSASFVQACYRLLLGRVPVGGEDAGWTAALDAGRMTRDSVVRGILASPEANGRLVDAVYAAWLKRPADAAGRAFWVQRLGRGLSFAGLAGGILGSAEVRSRTLAGLG